MKWIWIPAFILASIIRIIYFGHPEGFYSDSAIRYRYARMYSEGKRIPEVDNKILYPEGLRVQRLIHLTMDWIIGNSHRLIKPIFKVDLITFIRYFVSIFSALSVIAVFLIGRLMTRRKWSLIMITFLYAIAIAGYWRIVGNYLREEFVLPVYLFALYFFLKSFKEENYAFITGICFALTLISWHLSQFSYLVFLGFIILSYIFLIDKRQKIFDIFWRLLFPIIITSIIWPTLSFKSFFISIPMTLSYILILIHILSTKTKVNPDFLLPILLLAPIPILLSGQMGEYSHVFQLLMSKIRFLGMKPGNPALVPIDARLIWFGPFSSPGPYSILIAFGLTPILGLIAIPVILKRHKIFDYIIIYFLVAYLLSYLLIIRLEIFLLPFLAIAIGILFERLRKKTFQYLIIIIIIPEIIKTMFFPAIYQRYIPRLSKEWEARVGAVGDEFDRVASWFSRNSKKSDAVLAYIDVSAMLLARCGNPIVLEPIYELKEARDKAKDFMGMLYKSEDELGTTLRSNKIKYLLYQKDFLLDNSKSSIRYILGIEKVNRNSSVYKMNFFPESLSFLKLRYQTISFRVFEVDTERPAKVSNYSPYFDTDNFSLTTQYFADEKGVKKIDKYLFNVIGKYNRATVFLSNGRFKEAIPIFLYVQEKLPGFGQTSLYLATAYYRIGDIKNSLASIKKGMRYDQLKLDHFKLLGAILNHLQTQEAIGVFREYVSLVDRSAIGHLWFGYFLASKGIFKEAKKEFLQAKSLDPLNPEIDQAIDKINQDLTRESIPHIIPR